MFPHTSPLTDPEFIFVFFLNSWVLIIFIMSRQVGSGKTSGHDAEQVQDLVLYLFNYPV